jgi:hypothetical protein
MIDHAAARHDAEIARLRAENELLKSYLAQERAAKERAERKVSAGIEALTDTKGKTHGRTLRLRSTVTARLVRV